LYAHAGRLTAKNGGFCPGQRVVELQGELAAAKEELRLKEERAAAGDGQVGLGRTFASRYRPSTASQIFEEIRCLYY
jgi:hypothetical protein